MTAPILPGRAVGVLGSGQLGRMLALVARRMGYRVHVLSPDRDSPTGQVADREVTAAYADLDAVRAFARGVDVLTFEFENVPAATAAAASELVPVRPDGLVLHTTQNRAREKQFLASIGVPVPPFAIVGSHAELEEAVARIGCPAVLKTASFGYDGKGQAVIRAPESADVAWDAIGRQPAVLEVFVDFACELSVVAARGVRGDIAHYGVVENAHRHHILDLTVSPASVSAATLREADAIVRAVLEGLDVVGVLCVELFLARDGRLLVNELAPRPHNSGHFTIEACAASQFEQQLRAVCGLPLGSTRQHAPAAMANLLGDLWSAGEPDWVRALDRPGVALHLYGKAAPRAGRKMGHLTALAATAAAAREAVIEARSGLAPPSVASPDRAVESASGD